MNVTLNGKRSSVNTIERNPEFGKLFWINLWELNIITRILRKDRQEGQRKEEMGWPVETEVLCSQCRGRGHEPRNRQPLETGKCKLQYPLQPPKGHQPANNLLDFWLSSRKGNKLVMFQATKFVAICFSRNRKQISFREITFKSSLSSLVFLAVYLEAGSHSKGNVVTFSKFYLLALYILSPFRIYLLCAINFLSG